MIIFTFLKKRFGDGESPKKRNIITTYELNLKGISGNAVIESSEIKDGTATFCS